MEPKRLLVVFVVGLLLTCRPTLGAEDPAPVGSSWKGTIKRFGPPDKDGNRVHSSDARIRIQERKEDKFTGTLLVQNGKRVWEITGTISNRGAVKFTPTVRLKSPNDSDNPGDAIGRAEFLGVIKEGTLKGTFTVPKNTGAGFRAGRFGEMELTLEE